MRRNQGSDFCRDLRRARCIPLYNQCRAGCITMPTADGSQSPRFVFYRHQSWHCRHRSRLLLEPGNNTSLLLLLACSAARGIGCICTGKRSRYDHWEACCSMFNRQPADAIHFFGYATARTRGNKVKTSRVTVRNWLYSYPYLATYSITETCTTIPIPVPLEDAPNAMLHELGWKYSYCTASIPDPSIPITCPCSSDTFQISS